MMTGEPAIGLRQWRSMAGSALLLTLVPWMLSCGGSKPQPTSTPPAATPEAPIATGPTSADSTWSVPTEPWAGETVQPLPEEPVDLGVPVGVLAPFSGPYAAYGKS